MLVDPLYSSFGKMSIQVLCVFFFFSAVPCGLWILVFWPGIKPRPRQWKHQILTTGLLGNSLSILIKFVFCCWFVWAVYVFWILPSHHIYICKYLLPFSRLFLFFSWMSNILLWVHICICTHITSSLFIYQWILRFFHISVIVNNTTVNNGFIYLFELVLLFSLGK